MLIASAAVRLLDLETRAKLLLGLDDRTHGAHCTLTTCIHNCPSMIFRTGCCLRPKRKRSYLLIYITSGSYVNKLCKQVKRPMPPQNTCFANCGQTAAVSDMVTIDSLQELTNALSNGTIADPLRRTV